MLEIFEITTVVFETLLLWYNYPIHNNPIPVIGGPGSRRGETKEEEETNFEIALRNPKVLLNIFLRTSLEDSSWTQTLVESLSDLFFDSHSNSNFNGKDCLIS